MIFPGSINEKNSFLVPNQSSYAVFLAYLKNDCASIALSVPLFPRFQDESMMRLLSQYYLKNVLPLHGNVATFYDYSLIQ